jgi:hypothetical protein
VGLWAEKQGCSHAPTEKGSKQRTKSLDKKIIVQDRKGSPQETFESINGEYFDELLALTG